MCSNLVFKLQYHFPVSLAFVMFPSSPNCIVENPPRYQREISPVLASLHWSSVKYRVDFKILLFAFKSLCGLVPASISDLFIPHSASRLLRCCDQLLLSVSCPLSKYWGDRAFSIPAPWLWNSLPSVLGLLNCCHLYEVTYHLLLSDRNIQIIDIVWPNLYVCTIWLILNVRFYKYFLNFLHLKFQQKPKMFNWRGSLWTSFSWSRNQHKPSFIMRVFFF